MNRLRALVVALLGLALVACAGHKPRREEGRAPAPAQRGERPSAETSRPQSERYHKNQDGGPDAPAIDVSKIPEPVPKAEPRSRYGNRETYSVLGRTYRLLPDARGYSERGIASWYGNKFHGYMTSSFEPYDMYAFSAAHKTLPLPSYVRVTNLDNGKSVVVRVNDRGPFHENRLIDLSYRSRGEDRRVAEGHRRGRGARDRSGASGRVAADPHRFGRAGAHRSPRAPRRRPRTRRRASICRSARSATARTPSAPPRTRRAPASTTSASSRRRSTRRTVLRVRVGPLADVDAADATDRAHRTARASARRAWRSSAERRGRYRAPGESGGGVVWPAARATIPARLARRSESE